MKANHKDAVPFVILLIPFTAGILLRIYNPDILSWPLQTLFILALIYVLLNLLYKSLKVFKHQWLGGAIALIFLLLSGIIITNNAVEINKPDHFSKLKANNLVVKVTTEPVSKNGNIRFTGRVINVLQGNQLLNTDGRLLIYLPGKPVKHVNYGDMLLLPANYKQVSGPLNPAEFNYQRYLAHKNIYHQAYLSPSQFVIVKTGTGNSLIAYAQRLRKTFVEKFKLVITDPDAAAVASTLILGYSAELNNDVLQAYSKTGTIHVLSVSGAHVGLIYLVLLFMLAPFNNGTKAKLFITIVIITCIWGYALLTGFSPPVCRAGMMLSFILLGQCFARRISQLNILAVSAFVSLFADPLLITDVGFQLSYIAVAGLIVVQPLIYKKLTFNNKFADKMWLICSTSIAAQLVTLPLSTYYFHQVPVCFLLSNLLILIPSALIMYGGILYLLIPHGWLPGKWLGQLVEKLILFTNHSLSIIEHAPWSTIDRIWLSNTEFLLAAAIVMLIGYCIYKPQRAVVITLFAAIITISGLRVWHIYQVKRSKEIVFFSLRNDAAIALRDGYSLTLITNVDTNSKTYSYSLKPYIDSCGIKSIQITHFATVVKADQFTKNSDIISFNGQKIMIIEAQNRLSQTDNADIIYLKGKVDVNDDVIKYITIHQTVIIAGMSDSYYRQNLVNRLQQKRIKYIVCGSNKALVIPSN